MTDLWHHGDKDLAPGLLDFAVNVRQPRTPAWLVEAIMRDADWAAYPDPEPARLAIAEHHGVDPAMVLPTAGSAEAFTLIARAIPGSSLLVHPQFTEPEAALLAASRTPQRHVLIPESDFQLDPGVVPPADLIVVGNPTNPTAVLHSAVDLAALRAGVLVVDEAFLDAVPGEPETLIAPSMPGRLVLRSLTKTWALAGLRAGYVVGDPALIRALAEQQPPWSVSTPAIRATLACLTPRARAEAAGLARDAAAHRRDFARRLTDLGLRPVPGAAPFVLVDTVSNWMGSRCDTPRKTPQTSDDPIQLLMEGPRRALAQRGFAVRRGETFPGLGPSWLRLAVRTPDVHEHLVEALRQLGVGR